MTTNQLAGNAVRRPSEGSNQGNTSSIVLKESNVRSAVYRSKEAKRMVIQPCAFLYFHLRFSIIFTTFAR